MAPGTLVLADRNFYSYQAWQHAAQTGAALLRRVNATLTLPVLGWLPDGSSRSVVINPKICECRCGAPGWRTTRLGAGDPT